MRTLTMLVVKVAEQPISVERHHSVLCGLRQQLPHGLPQASDCNRRNAILLVTPSTGRFQKSIQQLQGRMNIIFGIIVLLAHCGTILCLSVLQTK